MISVIRIPVSVIAIYSPIIIVTVGVSFIDGAARATCGRTELTVGVGISATVLGSCTTIRVGRTRTTCVNTTDSCFGVIRIIAVGNSKRRKIIESAPAGRRSSIPDFGILGGNTRRRPHQQPKEAPRV